MKTFTVFIIGWLVPGAGYYILGRKLQAGIIFTLITFAFFLGAYLGEFQNVSNQFLFNMEHIEHTPQIGAGLYSLILLLFFGNVPANAPDIVANFDIGTLYTAVGGTLNLLSAFHGALLALESEQSPTKKITDEQQQLNA